jgi:hypothetical protein
MLNSISKRDSVSFLPFLDVNNISRSLYYFERKIETVSRLKNEQCARKSTSSCVGTKGLLKYSRTVDRDVELLGIERSKRI